MLSAKRTRVRLSTFVSLLVTVGIVSGLGAGLIGYLQDASTDGVRASLVEHTGADRALRLGQPLAADADRQNRAILGFVHTEFSTPQRAVPIASFRTVSADIPSQSAPRSESDPRLLTVESIPGLERAAHLIDGAWPTDGSTASIQADAADRLGVGVGDRVRLGGAQVTIGATWRADDPLDPRWMGDPLMKSGSDPTSIGPIVVAEPSWAQIGQQPWAHWTLVPDVTTITAHELDTILDAWPRFDDDILRVDTGASGLSQDGDFLLTAAAMRDRIRAVDALTPMVPLTLAAIALVAILELARLLSEIRSGETELLWSRGSTPTRLAGSTAVEAAITASIGAILGVGGAGIALRLMGHPDAPAAAGAAVWIVPIAAVAAAILIFGIQAFRAARLDARRDAPDRSGRGGRLAGIGVVVLVVGATAVSVWQLQLYGSPLTPTSGGGSDVDPLTVFAPSATLVSVVLIGLLLFPPVAAFAERLVARRRHAELVLAVRSIARRRALVATPLVIVGLAVGQFTIAGGYSASWATSFASAQALHAGTALRVTSPDELTDAQLGSIGAVTGVSGVAPISAEPHDVAGESYVLVGVAPRVLAVAGTRAEGAIDPQKLASQIDAGSGFPTLSAASGRLDMHIALGGFTESPRVSVWVTDADGLLRSVALESTRTDDGMRVSGRLPSVGTGSWRLAAIDVTPQGADAASVGRTVTTLRLISITAGNSVFPLRDGWDVFEAGSDPGTLEASDVRSDVPIAAGSGITRLMPPVARDGPIRVVLSTGLAQRIGAKPGMLLPILLNLAAEPVNTVVVGVAPGIPSSPDSNAMLIDLSVMQDFELHAFTTPDAPTSYWVITPSADPTGAALRHALPGDIAVTGLDSDPDRSMLGSAAVALWITAVSAGILALAAIGAVIAAQLRGRRAEVRVLRAVGARIGQQSSIRRRELTIVLAYATVVGLVAGAVSVLVTITAFARVAVPDSFASLPTMPLFDPIGLPLALGVFIGLLAVAVAVAGDLVARQARTALPREGEE